MSYKWLAFDIEVAAIIPENSQDWKQYRPLGITCAACAWQENGEIKIEPVHGWDMIPKIPTPAPRMNKWDCMTLVDKLEDAVKDGYTILGWNSLSFDFDILAEESGMHAQCAELARNHVDMMFQVFCLKGFPLGLDAVSKGLGLSGKVEGMSGALAPQLWADGKHEQVLAYVSQDVRTTLEVALAVEQRHGFGWIAKSGRRNSLDIERWLTVTEALQIPEPDTSWMSKPLPRSHFTEWMEKDATP